ncbi:MAG: hypothetical protein ABSD47_11970 [Candidatus Methylomirabilota bacterium]|jgi:hypothetical protein
MTSKRYAPQEGRAHFEPRLAYHLRCLREDATNPDLTALERLTLVRDRAGRIREIRRELNAAKVLDSDGRA